MPIQSSLSASQIEQLEVHLRTHRYAAAVKRHYLWVAKQFVEYIETESLAIESVHVRELEEFLQWELRRWRSRHGRAPRNLVEWRRRYKTALNMFLRLVRGHWPVLPPPATTIEGFHRDLIVGYDTWMRELRGLASITRSTRRTHALEFLNALDWRSRWPCAVECSRHRCTRAATL
jgi:hypothetical protein